MDVVSMLNRTKLVKFCREEGADPVNPGLAFKFNVVNVVRLEKQLSGKEPDKPRLFKFNPVAFVFVASQVKPSLPRS